MSVFRLEEARAVLARTPQALRALFDGLPEPWLLGDEGPDTFSPLEVLGHLVEAEERLWIPRAQAVLSESPAAFPAFDRFGHRTVHAGRDVGELLGLFASRRQHSLETLDALELDDSRLDRRGRHPEFGSVTLRQLLSTWVVHDLAHTRQICRVMAKRYRDDVGPWRSYLRVLDE